MLRSTKIVATLGPGHPAPGLTWAGFLRRNLVPVTIGNVIGGTLLVGLMYWFIYLRRREAVTR